ncbi:MAG TPA: radical SAM protein [Gammaproteobacteria bacterium]|nr:(Dimethylallyl)adenosine tRNA methylthiotransferase MiaB [bacterium BMS3Abin11]HDH15269.1 radical SAM protein [Gammaproteobacteria bacterium]
MTTMKNNCSATCSIDVTDKQDSAQNLSEKQRIVLISPYDLGRQPFALAEPAALFSQAGYEVKCLDLSQQKLTTEVLAPATTIFLYLSMLTATRIAIEAMPRIKKMAPQARIAVFGWYAPVNEQYLRELGVDAVFGGESEDDMLAYIASITDEDDHPARTETVVNLKRINFLVPDRKLLPALEKYAQLVLPDGSKRIMGFTETTRGCKHLCRHCPVVPVYKGRFYAVPAGIVLEDIRQQLAKGAEHISFGDPDFLNGPRHARRIIKAMHEEFPKLSYDAVIKIEHIIKYPEFLLLLRDSGCILVTTAAESVDNRILERLEKGHTAEDFEKVVTMMDEHNIALAPTFIPFTPWTTIDNYINLLNKIAELKLIMSVNPVQLSLRLLIPNGSRLLELPKEETCITDFKPASLGYTWVHNDPQLDLLQENIRHWTEKAENDGLSRLQIFNGIRRIALKVAGRNAVDVAEAHCGNTIPTHSESWYCCAEPTEQQLTSF